MSTDIKPAVYPTFKDTFNRTRLHYSVRFGKLTECRKLLESGADINMVDAFGSTPLSLACIDKPDAAMVKLLLKYNANVNLERPDNMDLLLECVLNCTTPLQISVIEILIQYGKNISGTDRLTNRSCMHLVALTGYVPLAKFLLRMGAIVNVRDNFNHTPIKLAKKHENLDVLNVMQTYLTEARLI